MRELLKRICSRLGLLPVIQKWKHTVKQKRFFSSGGSAGYWERTYAHGGNSGPGSYNRLAAFKAEVMNGFLAEHSDIESVIEWGCGDGNQLRLMNYPSYTVADVSKTAVELCRMKFSHDASKRFVWIPKYVLEGGAFDLSVSLDVIFHLVEDDVFETYMTNLFGSSRKYVCIYASNYDGATVLHCRTRCFTDYVEAHFPHWKLLRTIPNRYPYDPANMDETSESDFYFFQRDD